MIVDLSELHFADPSLMIDLAVPRAAPARAGPHAVAERRAAEHPHADRDRRAAPAARRPARRAAARVQLVARPRTVVGASPCSFRSSCSSSSCRSPSSRWTESRRRNVWGPPHAPPARPALHRRADRRAGGAHPGRPGDRRGWTIAILIADAILGSLLMRSQGRAAWRRFNEAMQAGRVPAREVLDGALVMFGGPLLLTPGFITDILGLLLLIPPTRALVRAVLAKRLTQRMVVSMTGPRARPDDVVDGTAVDVETDRLDAARGPALTDAGSERARRPTGPGFADAVTFASATRRAGLHGLARLGLSGEAAAGSALAVLFAGREPVAALARGGSARRPRRGLRAARAGRPRRDRRGAAAALDAAHRRRRARPSTGFDAAPPAEHRAVRAARPRRRHGRLRAALPRARDRAATGAHEVRCLGQRGHTWGEPDWERIESTRTLAAWLDDGSGVVLSAVRPGRHRAATSRRRRGPPCSAPPAACASTSRGSRRPTTRTAASAAPASSCGSARTTATRGARPARWSAARRSTSGSCGSTARSCAGAWTGRSGIGRYDVLRRA